MRSGGSRRVVEDRAFRPLVAVAAMRKVGERIAHCLQRADLVVELLHLPRGELPHVGTGATAVLPQAEQRRDSTDGARSPP
jgi:hypothetical protein